MRLVCRNCGKMFVPLHRNKPKCCSRKCAQMRRRGVERRSRTITSRFHDMAEYRAWNQMIQRCYNRNNPGYKNYGGRGIRVHRRWKESFAAFYEDVGPQPTSLHSLDRFPENNGNYKPGNVRWATRSEQNNNKRTCRKFRFGREMLSIAEIARRTGLKPGTLRNRFNLGWSVKRATSQNPGLYHGRI